MADYYVNKGTDSKSNHEVHVEDCRKMPSDRLYLGSFTDCRGAVVAAKAHYSNVNGCAYCSNACHTE